MNTARFNNEVPGPDKINGNGSEPIEIILPSRGKLESEFASEVGAHLAEKDAVFLHNNRVIEIQNEAFGGLDKNKLAIGGLKFRELTPIRAKTFVENYIKPGFTVAKKDEKGKKVPGVEFKRQTMPESLARSLLQAPQFLEKLSTINRILDLPVPILTEKGDIIIPNPGFNRELGIYCRPVAEKITGINIEQALQLMEQSLVGFPFKSNQAKIHALARLITPYARGLIGFSERLPLWFFAANRPRAGKDYLAGVAQIIYLGHAFEDSPLGKSSEETSKRITAALRSGRRMVHFANCQGHIDDEFLIQAITAKRICTRSLGDNSGASDLDLQNEIEYSMSANVGLTYREDIEPRCRKVELAFFEENENGRRFPNPDLHGWVSSHRSELLSAFYTIIQYWIEKGMPPGQTPFSSFPRWALVVGGIMVTCQLGDPCLPHEDEDLISGDQKTNAMRALYLLALEHSPGEWWTKPQLYDFIKDNQSANDRLSWFGDFERETTKTRMRLGKCLVAFKNRELSGIRLENDQRSANNSRWLYRFVATDAPVCQLGCVCSL